MVTIWKMLSPEVRSIRGPEVVVRTVAPCCSVVVPCPTLSAGVHGCVFSGHSSLAVQVWPGALPVRRKSLLGQTPSACDLRKLVIYARTPAVSSTQSAGTLDCRMVGGAVLQSVASNSVSLGAGRERSGAVADHVVQHWICHDAETKREGQTRRCRRATLTRCFLDKGGRAECREGERDEEALCRGGGLVA